MRSTARARGRRAPSAMTSSPRRHGEASEALDAQLGRADSGRVGCLGRLIAVDEPGWNGDPIRRREGVGGARQLLGPGCRGERPEARQLLKGPEPPPAGSRVGGGGERRTVGLADGTERHRHLGPDLERAKPERPAPVEGVRRHR